MTHREGRDNASACSQHRNAVEVTARANPEAALKDARAITLPWYRVQALASVVRHTKDNARAKVIVRIVRDAADSDPDAYRGSASLSWVVAACMERGDSATAADLLAHAFQRARSGEPASSRCDALQLLLRAGSSLGLGPCRPIITALHECILVLAISGDGKCRYRASNAFDCLLIHTKPMDAALARQLVDQCTEPRVRAKADKLFSALA